MSLQTKGKGNHMTQQERKIPVTYYLAWALLTTGLTSALMPLLLQARYAVEKGIILVALAFCLVGIGELLNHPKEQIFIPEGDNKKLPQFRRRRNVCGLGNLFLIVGLLLFFVGLSSLLFSK